MQIVRESAAEVRRPPPLDPSKVTGERSTLRLPNPPVAEKPAVPTAALFAIAFLLLGTAAGLWVMLVAT